MTFTAISPTLRLYGAAVLIGLVAAITGVWLYTSYEARKQAAELAALQAIEAQRHAAVERFVHEQVVSSAKTDDGKKIDDSNAHAAAAKAAEKAAYDLIQANQRARRKAKY
ncbi:MAG: hypothetical protein JSR64_09710 [Nitrospira sp.]|nr:hypothetical protein [Nitrospira sp.]MBS0194374.1 hypothetical protein [Pseudomonadota bacterium]